MSTYRGRFAPSPTGDLHLGTAAAALVAWLAARTAGGVLVLRVEDIDGPRVVPGAETRQLEDLAWLGLDWDEGPDVGGPVGPYRQSERHAHYEVALARLATTGLVFPCDCSRREIAAVASAPHAGEEGPRYPGTCRGKPAPRDRALKRPPATRLAVPAGTVTIDDRFRGRVTQDVAAEVGDFVLRRGDGVWAYQLAVVVDDLAMGVTEVVRGVDLLSSAPRQRLLARVLGAEAPPAFAHTPMLVAPGGGPLAKRLGGRTLRDMRADGLAPPDVVGALACLLGMRRTAAPTTARALAADVDLATLAAAPAAVSVPDDDVSGRRS